MFESAELGHEVSKEQWDAEVPRLRTELLRAQYELLEKRPCAVLVVIAGVDGAGKGETVNLLNEWLDPRHVRTHGMGPPTDEERQRPEMWRFWRRLPPKGRLGMFFGSWYTAPILDRTFKRTSTADLDQSIEQIVRFERMLANEGVLVLKFFFHLSKKDQKKRLETLESDPLTSWRVTDTDWKHFKLYDRFAAVCERTLRQTSTGVAPWIVVEGKDPRYRGLAVGRALLHELRRRLDEKPPKATQPRSGRPILPPIDGVNVLSSLDLSQKLSRKAYEKKLAKLSRDLALLSREKAFRERSLVAVWEGMDAAGKGGTIRRVTRALDARYYDVLPISAPSEEELAQPYLWRFWRQLPRAGKFAFFDRSWYGRVLVERVEGLATLDEWRRAYSEINDFEEQIVGNGGILAKFWLHLSPDEQLRRFRAREKTPFKKFKMTPDDWHNRERWDDYVTAACEMFDRTSTSFAPWTVVASEDKLHARIHVLDTLVERLESALR